MLHSTDDQPQCIRVLLADDHPLVREALRNLLCRQPNIDVVSEVDNGEDAVTSTVELSPDVVVLDISMPKLDGIETLRRIKARCPSVAVLVLTVHDDYEHVRRVLEVGGAGYLTKDAMGEQVIEAVKATASGDVVLSQAALRRVLASFPQPSAGGSPPSTELSDRELRVLRLAARGLTNSEIALSLGLSSRTVRGHLEEVFAKLNVASRTEAIAVALRTGLIGVTDLG